MPNESSRSLVAYWPWPTVKKLIDYKLLFARCLA